MTIKHKFIILLILTILFNSSLKSQVWLNNKIGINDEVPLPWKPLKILHRNDDFIVKCWGRDYVFNPTVLLKQVVILGEPVLAQPIEFVINQHQLYWNYPSLQVLSKEKSKIQLLLQSKAQLANKATLTLKNYVDVYYDGLIYFKTYLSSNVALEHTIYLDFKLNKDLGKYINRYSNVANDSPLWWKADFFGNDNSAFIPYWWVGNQEKGIFWFTESPKTWYNYTDSRAIIFTKDKLSANVRSKFKLNNNTNIWNFEFGIQATPVKPYPEDWRAWFLTGSSSSNINIIWPSPQQPYALKYFGYLEAKNEKAFKKHVQNLRTHSHKVLVYNNLNFISTATPEWKMYHNSWDIGYEDLSSDVKAYGDRYASVDFTSQTYQDFIVSKSNTFLKQMDLDGYYLDYAWINNINSIKPVRKFNNRNEKIPYFPFMDMRKLYERIYKMVKTDQSKMIIAHSSARIVPTILAFADMYIDGEQFRQDVIRVKDDYLKVTNLAAFQSEYSGKAYGIPAGFLPAFSEKYYTSIGPTRKLAGLLLLHDIQPWPIYSAINEWEEIREILNSFPGYISSEFISYYHTNPLAVTNDLSVKSSMYRNNRNEFLCIITNLSNVNKEIILRTNFKFLPESILQKTNRGTSYPVGNNTIKVSINPDDYNIIYIKKMPYE